MRLRLPSVRCSGHWVETIEWFVENQDFWLMAECLRQFDTLAHSFAICLNGLISRFGQVYLIQRNPGQFFCHRF